MPKTRVYELAKMLKVNSKDLIKNLEINGIVVLNHMSVLSEHEIEVMREFYYKNEKNTSKLKGFEVKNLFGKYSYEFNYEDVVNILISENGSGKTTILSLLVGILKGNLEKIRNIPFESITIHIDSESITVLKEDIMPVKSKDELMYILKKMRQFLPSYEYDRLRHYYIRNESLSEEELYHIIKRYEYEMPMSISNEFKHLIYNFETIDTSVSKKVKKISKLLSDEILYLPTYRRIEEDLDSLGLSMDNSPRISSRVKSSTINFGMNDVEDRINKLTNQLKEDAIGEYSKMNGEILDDLLTDRIKNSERIDEEKLKVIIGRIGKSKIKHHDELFKFVQGSHQIQNVAYLEYYLSKLIQIYDKQKYIDEKIKAYIKVCNGYLVNKKFVYDEVMAEVKLVDTDNKKTLNYSYLSSGEKQILSIFSKLYLEKGNRFIIIFDEPELSLSMYWQRKLLPDIVNSKTCSLLIATTHSPFIFQNEFSDKARELEMFQVE